MTGENTLGSKGLLESLKALTGTLVAIVHTRLAIFATDLEEERAHLVSLFVLTLVSLFCIGVGVILAALFVVVAFWDTHRLLALGGLTGLFLLAGFSASWSAKYKLQNKPKLFAATLAEFHHDLTQLPPRT